MENEAERKQKLLDALPKLDTENNNQWTVHGEPKLEVIKFLCGGESFTREEITAMAPGFSRDALRKQNAGDNGASNVPPPPPPPPVNAGNGTADNKPNNEPEQPAVDVGDADREAQIKAVESQIRRADEAIIEEQRIQAEAAEKIVKIQDAKNTLVDELNKMRPARSHNYTFKAFQATQKSIQQNRALARRAILETGIDLKAALRGAKSNLDAALSSRPRRRGR